MGMIISASINLTKLDKSKIIDGKGGKYYNLTLFVSDEKDKYGNDVSVVDKQTSEQIQAKEPKSYLGNGRVVWAGKNDPKQAPIKATPKTNQYDDLPF